MDTLPAKHMTFHRQSGCEILLQRPKSKCAQLSNFILTISLCQTSESMYLASKRPAGYQRRSSCRINCVTGRGCGLCERTLAVDIGDAHAVGGSGGGEDLGASQGISVL